METQHGGRYRSEGVEISLDQRWLKRDGKILRPRTRVFDLLAYLLEHRDRVVGREELTVRLWPQVVVGGNSLDQCVIELRKHLDDDARDPRFIRTVPRVGYQYIAPVEWNPEPTGVAATGGNRKWHIAAGLAAAAAGLGLILWMVAIRPAQVQAPERGEAAWWPLNNLQGKQAPDRTGHRNSGALEGGAGRWQEGLVFDGVDDVVTGLNAGRGFPRHAEPRSLTAWLKTATTNGDATGILYYGGEPDAIFYLSLRGNGLLAAGTHAEEVRSLSRLDDGQWHLAAVVYDGPASNTARIFVDGEQQAEQRFRSPVDTGTGSPWRIGRLHALSTPFRGQLRDVRLFSHALSATEMMALYRCGSRQTALAIEHGSTYYAIPLFAGGAGVRMDAPGELWNTNSDLSGIQFAVSDGVCALESLRGAEVGQDLYLGVDLLVPPQPGGQVVVAGPYFRSRPAAPGDGIIGGASAGYWVQLQSSGIVTVRCLNPHRVVAFTRPQAGFDGRRYHRLELVARGPKLTVQLDGLNLEFDQGGRLVHEVSVPPAWQGRPELGVNRGAAGIAFGMEYRPGAGGQRARRMTLKLM